MADVQPNKVVRIATNLFEAIYKYGLTAREYTVLLCIIRWTYGFNRKQCPLSLGFIEKDTGIARPHISKALKSLECQNIVMIQKSSGRDPQQISLQKDFDKWVNCYQISNSYQKSNCYQNGNSDCYQISNTDCYQNGNQDKTNIYKTNIYDNISSSNHDLTDDVSADFPKPDLDAEFEEIWKSYPRKEGKKVAKDKYVKARTRKKDPATFEMVKHGVECYAEKMKDTPTKYIKHGDAWMNQECWNDYLQAEMPNDEKGGESKKWE